MFTLMNHIELFAGCGGLSLGLETAGFELLLANELSPMAAETFAYNILNIDFKEKTNLDKVHWISSVYQRADTASRLKENPELATGLKSNHYSDLIINTPASQDLKRSLLVGSIVDLNSLLSNKDSALIDFFKRELGDKGVDLVSGGPPCQSFSLAGLRNHSNKRNSLPWEFAKFVDRVKPKLVLLENVSGILGAFKVDGKSFYAWFEVAKAFAKIGYIPLCLHVNAKYVGAAQNRPRFILIAIREDIFLKLEKNSDDHEFIKAVAPAKALLDNVKNGGDPQYGCLPCYDIEKHPELFSSSTLSSLASHQTEQFATVKDAIDDLRGSGIKDSAYVKKINSIFENRNGHSLNKAHNHDNRSNTDKVKARFRLYQIMSKLEKRESKEISKYLKSSGATRISNPTLNILEDYWVLDLNGDKISKPDKHQLLGLLSNLYTKKQTQRALKANLPAPAALSIPDDACHYHESVENQRTLTVREMARIQSFPDWYQIKSKITTGGEMRRYEVPQYTQVGNAVPPLLGLALGKVCKALIDHSCM